MKPGVRMASGPRSTISASGGTTARSWKRRTILPCVTRRPTAPGTSSGVRTRPAMRATGRAERSVVVISGKPTIRTQDTRGESSDDADDADDRDDFEQGIAAGEG